MHVQYPQSGPQMAYSPSPQVSQVYLQPQRKNLDKSWAVSKKFLAAVGASLTFLIVVALGQFAKLPDEVYTALAISVATCWPAVIGVQGYADGQAVKREP